MQRLLLLLSTSLPGCFAFAHASTTPMFAFGLCNIGLEVFTRRVSILSAGCAPLVTQLHAPAPCRPPLPPPAPACPSPAELRRRVPLLPPKTCCLQLRLHLQLLNSLLIYAITLSLMSLHPEGSPGRTLITRERQPWMRCMRRR